MSDTAKGQAEQLSFSPEGSIYYYDTLPSTNDKAKELAAKGAPHGTVIIAGSQTNGRGRMGRSFYSPSGTGLYMSIILRPDISAELATCLTAVSAVAVHKTLYSLFNKETEIKWVNDLLLDSKKVCGILAEGAPLRSVSNTSPNAFAAIEYIVIGIGINLSDSGFPSELAGIAGSLQLDLKGNLKYPGSINIPVNCGSAKANDTIRINKPDVAAEPNDIILMQATASTAKPNNIIFMQATASTVKPNNIIFMLAGEIRRQLISEIIRVKSNILSGKAPLSDDFIRYYSKFSAVIGKNIRVIQNGTEFTAYATGIDDQGGLIVTTDEGQTLTLRYGEVTIRI